VILPARLFLLTLPSALGELASTESVSLKRVAKFPSHQRPMRANQVGNLSQDEPRAKRQGAPRGPPASRVWCHGMPFEMNGDWTCLLKAASHVACATAALPRQMRRHAPYRILGKICTIEPIFENFQVLVDESLRERV
jgi:hypothetical protein